MGGKQSIESSPQSRTNSFNAQASEQSAGSSVASSRRPVGTRSQPDTSVRISESSPGRMNMMRDPRMARANSMLESTSNGLRIPHHRLGWLYSHPDRDSDSSPEEPAGPSRMLTWIQRRSHISQSLPHYLRSSMRDSNCPMCGKLIPAEDIEVHFVMCLTKPRVTYNEDVLSTCCGECSICLEDLEEGQSIARLPCLCVYHKGCIEEWFQKSQTCPEHPPD